MEEIKENGPVQMGFKVFEDFFMYKSGIYSKHPNARVARVDDPYHSVKVLGWGSENGVDYWVTKQFTQNSINKRKIYIKFVKFRLLPTVGVLNGARLTFFLRI